MALCDYEETITSYIHDDDKMVTYKWLSKELEIHVNVAKDILQEYWKKYKVEEKIVATYLLIGQLKNGSIRVEVVKESNLKDARDKFAQVNCEHLYSLQKYLEDIQLLAFAGDGDIRYSAIKCKDEYLRNDEEIDSLRYVGNTKKEENKPTESGKDAKSSTKSSTKEVQKPIDSVKEKPKNVINKKDDSKQKQHHENKEKSSKPSESKPDVETQVVEKKISPTSKSSNGSKSNNKISKKPVQSKQSGFNNLFGKVPNKPKTTNKSKEDDEKSISSTITMEKEEKNLELFKDKDTKLEEQEKAKKSDKEKETKSEKLENKNKKQSLTKLNISKTNNKSDDKIKAKGKNDDKIKAKDKNDVRGKKRNRSQENSVSSKRKRILVLDSSEDESGVSDKEENEEPMEVEEEPAPVVRKKSPSPPAEKRENGKRMIRKTIDKTHKDEDGFLVTKRVHVYEAVSDTEEVSKEVKKEESQKQVPIETVAKKKQTTLMNFFKKS